MVVKPGLKTRLKNSRAQGFNDILLTLRLTKVQILPRFTASVDRLLHLLERTAVDSRRSSPFAWWYCSLDLLCRDAFPFALVSSGALDLDRGEKSTVVDRGVSG